MLAASTRIVDVKLQNRIKTIERLADDRMRQVILTQRAINNAEQSA